MLVDSFIPIVWFNSVFSYLKNFEVKQSPIEEGTKSDKFFFTKRDWFYSEKTNTGIYKWELEWNFVGKEVFNDIAYIRDDLWKVYSYEKDTNGLYVLTKIYDNPVWLWVYTKDTKWNLVPQRCKKIQYITWFKKSWTVLSSTNFWWGGTDVELIVNEPNTFDISDVGSYIYIPYSASSDFRFQIRVIIDVVNDTTVHLSEQFYNEPTVWTPWETYDTIWDVIVFNNLKYTNDQVLTYDVENNAFHLRSLWWKDIAVYDGRYWSLTLEWTAVGWSVLTWEYEIIDPTTVRWNNVGSRWEKILSIESYKTYLLLFYKTSIAVVRQIWQDSSSNPIYNYNEILWWVGLFSANSYVIKEWWLYIFTQDKTFNWLDIKPQSTNIIEGILSPQWSIIQKQLNSITSSDYVECFSYDVGVGVYASNDFWTKFFKYTLEYKGRYYHESYKKINNYYKKLYSDNVLWYDKYVCLEWWNVDFDANIDQEVQIKWPWQTYWDAFTILQIKFLLWFYNDEMDFELELDLWWEKFIWYVYDDAKWISYIRWQNIASANGALSQVPLQYMVLWWINSIKENIWRIWLIWLRVWKSWVYYKLTVKNKDNKHFNFGSIMVQYKQWNPLVVPIKNVT